MDAGSTVIATGAAGHDQEASGPRVPLSPQPSQPAAAKPAPTAARPGSSRAKHPDPAALQQRPLSPPSVRKTNYNWYKINLFLFLSPNQYKLPCWNSQLKMLLSKSRVSQIWLSVDSKSTIFSRLKNEKLFQKRSVCSMWPV